MMETVNDLLQSGFAHRMLRIFSDFAQNETSHFREVLHQLPALLLGKIVGIGKAAFNALRLVIPCVGQNEVLGISIELVAPAYGEKDLHLNQLAFLCGTNAKTESGHNQKY